MPLSFLVVSYLWAEVSALRLTTIRFPITGLAARAGCIEQYFPLSILTVGILPMLLLNYAARYLNGQKEELQAPLL